MKGAYCKDSYKVKSSYINYFSKKQKLDGEYSLSLGDVTALADHIAHYGPLKNIPRAKNEGLLRYIEDYLGQVDEGADGFIEDVAEDSCELEQPIAWEKLSASIEESFKNNLITPTRSFMPVERAPLPKSSSDPAGVYTFDNPQYLDLILNNHHHFGNRSYETWLGYHANAISIKNKTCDEIFPTDDDCMSFKESIHKQVLRLIHSIEDKDYLVSIREELVKDKNLTSQTLERITTNFISLVFEAGGIHFLQDNFSGGHLRGNRGDMNLEDARYFHDTDSKNGVIAYLQTSHNDLSFLSYGDDFLLSHSDFSDLSACKSDSKSRSVTSACLLVKQRELILGATAASLLDWAHGGVAYDEDCNPKKNPKLCKYLPTSPVSSEPVYVALKSRKKIRRADLPQSPPDFSYQSLTFQKAFNNSNDILHLGMNLSLLNSLGSEATWLTSYNLSWNYAHAENFGKNSFEFSYMFHWRWATRFLIGAAPYLELGEQYKDGVRKLYSGLGTKVGFSILPEGWIRLPLEFGVYVKTPLNLYDPEGVKTRTNENSQIIEVSVGLAFL